MYSNDRFYFDVPRPERLSRLLIFVKWLLIWPHLFVMYFYAIAAAVVGFFAWIVVLITGRFPEGMWRFIYVWERWQARISIYTMLLRDEYPPFGEDRYPMEFQITRPQRSSRLLVVGRIFLIIPLAFWLAILGVLQSFLLIFAWVMILFTGNIPSGVFDLLVGILRYGLRVSSYSMLLTDQWPGFDLANPE